MKTSSRGIPLSRNPCPTLSSLPYACAVSICRYPTSSAQPTASAHSRPFGICQTPRPTSGISLPSASTRALPSAVTTSVDIASPLNSSKRFRSLSLFQPRSVPFRPAPPSASTRLRDEHVDVGGELAVVLEEKAVGRVRVDLDPRVREEPGQEVRVTGQDHRVAVAVGNEDREFDRGDALEQRVVGNAPGADGVILRLARLPGRRFVSVGCPCAEDACGGLL